MKFLQNVPTPVKIALAAALLFIVVLAGAFLRDYLVIVLIVLAVGAVLCIGVLLLMAIINRKRESKQGDAFSEGLKQGARNAPAGADKARKARLDDLAHVFEEGVSKYRAAGKNLYSLPWYLLVGPPGSGKTEAMRHSSIGFPPGLQDPLQGTGGTLSMHWWFTNTAVVLDTAGRLFMSESVNPSESSEWKEFLKLLKRARSRCPINGMLLAVDVETLLKDNAEQIEKKAGAIARQLDAIQRVLDVRFPVFVLVTKCDRIVGFREFFESMNDPQAAHQMLGWSNPADLDDAFNPEAVDQHLQTVRASLLRRRRLLVLDPVHTEDASARRTDQVDAMYAFPEGLAGIGPRLRRFLELIFVAGEWSPKPLFLRGIYFTSSLQEGRSLDEALAKALGCPIDELPGDAVPRKDKSYFLRDLFVQKVFREKGLVTSAVNVSKAQRMRRGILLSAGIGFAALLIGLTVLGGMDLSKRIGTPARKWREVSDAYKQVKTPESMDNDENPLSIVRVADGRLRYAGDRPVFEDSEQTRATLPIFTYEQATASLSPGAVFAPLAFIMGDTDTLKSSRLEAHKAVLESSVLAPLVRNARKRLADADAWGLDTISPTGERRSLGLSDEDRRKLRDAASRALAQIIRIETFADGQVPVSAAQLADGGTLLDVEPLVALLEGPLGDEKNEKPGERKRQLSELGDVITRTYYASGKVASDWPPASVRAGDEESKRLLALAADRFREAAAAGAADGFAPVVALFEGVAQFVETDKGPVAWPSDSTTPAQRTLAEFARVKEDWDKRAAQLADAQKRVDRALSIVGKREINAAFVTDRQELERKRIEDDYNRLLRELPEPAKAGGPSILDSVKRDLKKEADSKGDSAASKGGILSETGRDLKKTIGDSATGAGAAGKQSFAKLLAEGKDKAQEDLKKQGDRYREMLGNPQQSKLLERVRSEDEYRIVLKLNAVRAAARELDGALLVADAFKPDQGNLLTDAARKIKVTKKTADGKTEELTIGDDSRDAAMSNANKWELDQAGAPGGFTSLDGIRRAHDAARAARMARLIEAYANARTGGGSLGWNDLAKSIKTADAEPAVLQIPLIELRNEPVPEDKYRPGAAKCIFADFALADDECSPTVTRADRPLESDRIREKVSAIRPNLRLYARAYFDYWTQSVRGLWQCRTFAKWSDYRRELDNVVVASVSEKVAAFLRDQVLAALQAIPTPKGDPRDALVSPQAVDAARQQIEREVETLGGTALRNRMGVVRDNWVKLSGSSARQAAADLASTGNSGVVASAEEVEQRFFDYRRSSTTKQVTSEFWTSVWLEGLRLLAQDRADKARSMLNDMETLRGFPLTADGAKTLTREQVAAFAIEIDGIVNEVLDKPLTVPVGEGAMADTLNAVNSALSRAAASDLGPGAKQRFTQLRDVAKSLAADGQPGLAMQFTIVGNGPDGGQASNLMINAHNYVQVLVDGKLLRRWTEMRAIENEFPFEVLLGASDVTIQFASSEDAAEPARELKLEKPWSLLKGLRNPPETPRTDSAGGKPVWYLPFAVKTADGVERRVWVKMREKGAPSGLPAAERWPKAN